MENHVCLFKEDDPSDKAFLHKFVLLLKKEPIKNTSSDSGHLLHISWFITDPTL